LEPPENKSTPARSPDRTLQPRKKGIDLHQTFTALKYPNYRLWFFGQMVSLVGTWMQSTAQAFLIYELTKSPAYLGYVGFISGVPTWLFTLYGGVIADRMPRRTLLVITQVSMMILAFIQATLTFTGLVQPWHILALAFLLGIANAFDAPARMSFVLEMVDREDMTNAIALNSTMFNSATAVGPAAAGLTYAVMGPAWCFTLNGFSFIAVIIALLLMKLKPWHAPEGKSSAVQDIKIGIQYVISHSVIRVLILGIGMMTTFGLGFVALLPAWAVTVVGGDATTNGLLQSARGVGALIAALMIASMSRFNGKGRVLTLGSFLFPIFLFIFALIHWIPASLLSLVVVGWAFMLVANLTNALVQTQVQDDLRGRVMGVYTLVFNGMIPIGSLLAGTLADRISEPVAVKVMAMVLMVYSIFAFIFFPQIRRAD
jgi:predicted MFS family arabinose efflux permease